MAALSVLLTVNFFAARANFKSILWLRLAKQTSRAGFLILIVFAQAAFAVELTPPAKKNQQETASSPAADLDLGPKAWTAWERQAYSKLQQGFNQPSSLAKSQKGMVAGTSAALAVHAGLNALEAGGNAMDAALTTALAQVVLDAGCWNSYAGILNLVYYDAKTGEITSLNGGYNIPRMETTPGTIPGRPHVNGRAVLVGGFFPAFDAAHKRHGCLPYKTLFGPAIHFSEEGFALDPMLAALIRLRKDVLSRLPETLSIFESSPGKLIRAGENLKQPALAVTLRLVAEKGANGLYRGDWSQEVAKKVQAIGGRITAADFAEYSPIWEDAQSVQFAGCRVYTLGRSELGGSELLEGLRLAQKTGLTQDKTTTQSAETKYMLMQISKLSHLLSSGEKMSPEERTALTNLYLPHLKTAGWEISLLQKVKEIQTGSHSDSVVAWDSEGNVAALVHSINTTSWGDLGLIVGGVSIPDSGCFQQQRSKLAGPGGRLKNLTNPVIVLRDNKPCLAAGAIGAGLHEVMFQNLTSILVGGMDPHQADRLPKFWGIDYKPTPLGQFSFFVEKGTFSEGFLKQMLAMKQPLTLLPASAIPSKKGYWVGIRKTKNGLEGCSPRYFNGLAEGQ